VIRALIIDDEESTVSVLQLLIKKNIPEIDEVFTAIGAHEGLKMVQQCNPHLLFLDIEMPYMSGFELLENFPPKTIRKKGIYLDTKAISAAKPWTRFPNGTKVRLLEGGQEGLIDGMTELVVGPGRNPDGRTRCNRTARSQLPSYASELRYPRDAAANSFDSAVVGSMIR